MLIIATRRAPQHFRASLLWCVKLIAMPVVVICGGPFILLSNFFNGGLPEAAVAVVLCLLAAALLAYFLGNLNVLWPYAVDIHPETEIVLSGPLKKLRMPISDLSYVQDSFFWQGQAVIEKTLSFAGSVCHSLYFGSSERTSSARWRLRFKSRKDRPIKCIYIADHVTPSHLKPYIRMS
jgi:hypothetical protein